MGKSLLHSITAGIGAFIKTATVFTAMLVSAASAFAAADANSYVPMIREGRVWEYTGSCGVTGEPLRAFHYMKFDGTAEFNGVEYHRFVQFKTIVVGTDDGKVRDRSFGDLNVYYMREDAGKVYVLYDSHDGRIVSQDMEQANGFKPTGELKEFKVYDFTLSDGERWAYPFYLTQGVSEDLDQMEEKDMQTVQYETPREIDGETCRVMSFQSLSVMGSEDLLKFIEGVGPTMNGHLAVPNLGNVSGVVNNSSNAGVQSSLNRVLDAKGNVIYTRPDSVEPPANDGVVPTIREDRVWCYAGYDYSKDEVHYLVNHYIHFDGTVDVGEKTYHKGILFKTVRYVSSNKETGEYYSGSYPFYDERGRSKVMYYLREEEGRVYQLRQAGEKYEEPLRTLPENPNPADYTEKVLYDWNLSDGDSWNPEAATHTVSDNVLIHYRDDVDIDGESCRRMGFDGVEMSVDPDFKIIEGVGPTCHGSVGEYFFHLPVDNYMDSSDGPCEWSYLQCVYNGEGKLIYGEEVKLANAVNDIITDNADDAEVPVYDLMGRRVTNPLPGSVYIRAGRKFIGK